MPKKKLLYLSTTTYPSISAGAVQNAKMCDAFTELGYQVSLVAYSDTNATPDQLGKELKKTYNLNNDVNMRIRRQGKGFYSNLFSIWRAIFFANLKANDLVFTRDLRSAFVATLMGKRTILEIHHPEIIKKVKWVDGLAESRPEQEINRETKILSHVGRSKNTAAIIVINDYLKSLFEKAPHIDSQKLLMARCGTTAHAESYRTQILRGEYRVNIGYTGRLFEGKGMEVISSLASQCPEMGFHIVGGSEDEVAQWEQTCRKLPNIFFYGYHPHHEIGEFLQAFDILLLPNQKEVILTNSQIDIGQSTSPLKAFEYMAARKPIIASDIPALSEFLRHGDNAMLCDPANINTWVDTIKKLSDNIEEYKFLAENAHKDFIEHFTLQGRAKTIVEHAYRNVI